MRLLSASSVGIAPRAIGARRLWASWGQACQESVSQSRVVRSGLPCLAAELLTSPVVTMPPMGEMQPMGEPSGPGEGQFVLPRGELITVGELQPFENCLGPHAWAGGTPRGRPFLAGDGRPAKKDTCG